MPELSALQSTLGGNNFAVVTIATGPNPPDKIAAFFKNIKIDNLPSHRDPRQALAREMGVLALPTTIVLDREGQEIARLLGDANWHSDSALAIIQALIEP
ncbi:MAG: TlpA disulfide reductase family protein, partial [Planktomarina sp.]|nr:TlpA disulfide reductase family protein [Planktomarina sp.]